ncbi:hypothetical protein [Staphylococcus sp. GDY8P72P]|uniref:hypothetical protein n=1 Tax=Staphylococcus sp. GDY8P72P TaxID=2804425 RepID=UPI00195093FD|nr:hypothetical protein [Staphylococcus sp. GDY8P72P]MDN0189126.1 hypothetical protein [Staphylococcus arlettae]MDN0189163.1 hypothetical protein [Staphylococcus arlettae]MDN0189241.1 hypothetical protein [Staphylococcus arlettae]MDN0189275.1 hypothetical protein [Staphylococcus arlettae]
MNSAVKQRTIEWLEQTQGQGSFDGFDEQNKDFRQCTDDEIEWYFVEWFFTDGLRDDLTEAELKENYSNELLELERINRSG